MFGGSWFYMLRLSIHYTIRGQGSVDPCANTTVCRCVTASSKLDYVEVWAWCRGAENLLTLIEEHLYMGLIPVKLGLLDGTHINIEKLDFNTKTLEEIGSKTLQLTGKLVLKLLSNPDPHNLTNTINLLLEKAKKLKLDYRNRRIVVELQKPVDTTTLFDNLLRIIKPIKIPP